MQEIGNILTNVLDVNSGLTINYERVTKYYDGTDMTDAKADGKLYLKMKDGSGYVRQVLQGWGENFLNVDTMADLRALDDYNLLLIKAGYYKGVTLLGYYNKGEYSLNYLWNNVQGVDDGGSVINVGGGSFEAVFINMVKSTYFGAKCNGIDDDYKYTQKMAEYMSKSSVLDCEICDNTYLLNSILFYNTPRINIYANNIVYKASECIIINQCPSASINNVIIDGKSDVSNIGIRVEDSINFKLLNVTINNIGNSTISNTRGVTVVGDCSYLNVDGLFINNIVGSSVASGLSIVKNNNKYSQFCKINNLNVKDVYPREDSDGFKILQIGLDNNITLTNSTFTNCSKRGIKLQGRFNNVDNCKVYGECFFAGIDAQEGHSTIQNCKVKVTTTCESLISLNALDSTIQNCEIEGSDLIEYTNLHRGIKLTSYSDSSTIPILGTYLNINNIKIKNIGRPILLYEISNISMNISITNIEADNFYYPYVIYMENITGKTLKIENIIKYKNNNVYYSLIGTSGVVNFEDMNLKSDYALLITPNKITTSSNGNIDYGRIHTNIRSCKQNNGKLIIESDFSPLSTNINSNLLGIINKSIVGWEIINTNQNFPDIEKYICTKSADGLGTDVGTWRTIYRLNKSTPITNATSADATDLETALVLINELKAKLNAKLAADRASGQQAI